MFLEYVSLTGLAEFPTFSFEFISRIVVILFASLALIAIGYKIKGGAAILIVAFFFLYVNGMLPL
jgi:hypothetical protein